MYNRRLPIRIILIAGGDAVVALATIIIALAIRYGGMPPPEIIELYRFASPILICIWILGFTVFGLYDIRGAKNNPAFFDQLIRAIIADFVVTVIILYIIPVFGLRPLITLATIFIVLSITMALWRAGVNAILAHRTIERVLFYGSSDETSALIQFLKQNPQFGLIPIGILENGGPLANGGDAAVRFFPKDSDIARIIRDERIHRIVVAPSVRRTPDLIKTLFSALPAGIAVSDFAKFYESVEGKVPVSLISEAWFIENLIGMKRPRYEFVKRIMDLILAIVFGAVAMILFPIIALAIVMATPRDILRYRTLRARKDDGIIFFRQPRVGRNGRVFNFIKFRSQVLGAERFGSEKREGPDPRAYSIGTFLRKTYLDELPQVWNVLRGDMSFVGPRPERPEFVRELADRIPFYRMRELVLPGITGWAQISMANDATVSDAPEKIQYDLFYIKNRSVALDLVILAKTALKLIQRSGR